MFRKPIFKLFVVSLALMLASADSLAQSRISFRRGRSSATVRGKIAGNGYREYMVNGRAGQLMTIEITSGNGAVEADGTD